jgi:hypothetical protein
MNAQPAVQILNRLLMDKEWHVYFHIQEVGLMTGTRHQKEAVKRSFFNHYYYFVYLMYVFYSG